MKKDKVETAESADSNFVPFERSLVCDHSNGAFLFVMYGHFCILYVQRFQATGILRKNC